MLSTPQQQCGWGSGPLCSWCQWIYTQCCRTCPVHTKESFHSSLPLPCHHKISIISCFSAGIYVWCFNVPWTQHLISFYPVNSSVACLNIPSRTIFLSQVLSHWREPETFCGQQKSTEKTIISQDLKIRFQEWANSGRSGKWERSSCRVKGTKSISHSLWKIIFHKWKWYKWKIPSFSSREACVSPGLGLQRVLLSSHSSLQILLNRKVTSALPIIEEYQEDECGRVLSVWTPWFSCWRSNIYCFKIKV